jgi:Icc protein
MRLPGREHVILLAHISDLHVNGTPRATERVKRAIDHLRALITPPDALLVTGDIADHGDPAEYQEVAALLEAPFPTSAT